MTYMKHAYCEISGTDDCSLCFFVEQLSKEDRGALARLVKKGTDEEIGALVRLVTSIERKMCRAGESNALASLAVGEVPDELRARARKAIGCLESKT
jgi:hypothetical protein